MFMPFDPYTFEVCQTRRMREIRAEVEQMRLAHTSRWQNKLRFRQILTILRLLA
jgi:hypothetical protein